MKPGETVVQLFPRVRKPAKRKPAQRRTWSVAALAGFVWLVRIAIVLLAGAQLHAMIH